MPGLPHLEDLPMTERLPHGLMIADDLTGALDSSVAFAERGWRVRVQHWRSLSAGWPESSDGQGLVLASPLAGGGPLVVPNLAVLGIRWHSPACRRRRFRKLRRSDWTLSNRPLRAKVSHLETQLGRPAAGLDPLTGAATLPIGFNPDMERQQFAMNPIKRVAIVGAELVGCRWAVVFARAGAGVRHQDGG